MIACMRSRRISRNLTKSFVTSVTPLKRPRCSQPVLAEPYRSPKMVRLVRTGWSRAYFVVSIVIDVITVRCHPTTQTILPLDTLTTNYLSLNSYHIFQLPRSHAVLFQRLT